MKRREPRAYGVRCFPFSDVLSFLLERKRKRFLAFARNDGMGKRCGDTTLPPSYGRRCPEGAEVGFPSTAEGAFFRLPFAFPFANETPWSRSVWSTVFPVFRCPPISLMTANEKDFSLALEMKVWESGILASLPFSRGRALSVTIGRSKSFCCLSEIKKEHCHRAMLFLTFCAYQKYSFQTRKIVPSGKFRQTCILTQVLRARG